MPLLIIIFPLTRSIWSHCDLPDSTSIARILQATDRNSKGLSVSLDEAVCVQSHVGWISALCAVSICDRWMMCQFARLFWVQVRENESE